MVAGLVLFVVLAGPAVGDDSPAARAQRHFEAQEWDQAIEALIEAYADDPDPAYLYARAQAERNRGNCRVAVGLYRRFLRSEPLPKQRADTERHIRYCEELLFEEEVEAPAKPPPAEPEPAEPEPKPVRTRPRPRRDVVGPILLGTGLAGIAAGLTVTILGNTARRRAPEAATEDDYESEGRRGTVLLATGISVATVGAALVAGAIARFALTARRRPNPNAKLTATGLTVRF